ncbi:MAG: hypothetical protein U9R28_11625 [Pseudomonadota bacterium]|nr:hypothetical protein [Pseudomonadota bacterium]
MIYIRRNSDNEIIEIDFSPAPHLEEIGLFDPQLKAFLQKSKHSEELIKTVLDKLDNDMVRVIEDVVDVLIDKDVLRFTDLPSPVQNKLLFKKSIRNSLKEENSILNDEEILNF